MSVATNVGDLGREEFERRLGARGLGVRIGPFHYRFQVSVPETRETFRTLYSAYPLVPDGSVFSAHVKLEPVRRWRSWKPPVVRFTVDARAPHEDMPRAQGYAVLEWGLNLVTALRFQRFLMLHAAVLERNGGALLLPAAPGFGKTTLCAALAHRNWRLLSDEFGLVRPDLKRLVPLPRPMPLKNESIEVIRQFAPEAVFGPSIPNTRKGTVAHVRAPADSVTRAEVAASARWIVFPRWVAVASLDLRPLGKTAAFMHLVTNAFNYEALGEVAFETARALVDGAQCYTLVYSRLEEAVALLSEMADAAD